jgi:mannan endo-1,4-beta-mannosidase
MKRKLLRFGSACLLALVIAASSASVRVAGQSASSDAEFVQRRGTELAIAGRPFGFGGMNIEWLGLEDYGPKGKVGPHVPTDFEVEDALSRCGIDYAARKGRYTG